MCISRISTQTHLTEQQLREIRQLFHRVRMRIIVIIDNDIRSYIILDNVIVVRNVVVVVVAVIVVCSTIP